MADEIEKRLTTYMAGGDRAGFGGREPLKKAVGGGGLKALAKALTCTVQDVDDCPEGESNYDAIQFGQIISGAQNKGAISASDVTLVRVLMQVAYGDDVSYFNNGMNMIKAAVKEEEDKVKTGSHGGKIPTKLEAQEIYDKKGMSWQECVAVSGVLWCGIVPTEGEIMREGYGSDPALWQSAKDRRKAGGKTKCALDFIRDRDAVGYRKSVLKGTQRMAAGKYKAGAAFAMLFVNKLSHMTFDQGMPELMLDYMEEHLEAHKGEGLGSVENPLDSTILTETVLAHKVQSRESDSKLSQALEAIEASDLKIDAKLRSRLGEVTALGKKVESLERQLQESRDGGGGGGGRRGGGTGSGPPGPQNPCNWCKAEDHFLRDCPKKKAADEKRKAEARTAKSEDDDE